MTQGRKTSKVIQRVTRLILLLRKRRLGVTAKDVAGEIDVSYRTAYRYLKAVERAGLPLFVDVLEVDYGSGGTHDVRIWRLVEGWR